MVRIFLILETATANKLTHDTRWRNLLVTDGDKVVDELQQAMSLGVLRTVFGN